MGHRGIPRFRPRTLIEDSSTRTGARASWGLECDIRASPGLEATSCRPSPDHSGRPGTELREPKVCPRRHNPLRMRGEQRSMP